jgi:HK97 family phage major capsid protein
MSQEKEIVDAIKSHVDEKFVQKGEVAPLQKQVNELQAELKSLRTRVPADVKRYGGLKCFKSADTAYAFGKLIQATLHKHPELQNGVTKQASDWCLQRGLDINFINKAQSEGVNTEGGFTVFDQIDNDIIDLRERYGIFRQHAKVVPMSSDLLKINRRTGGLTGYWVAEAGSLTQSQKAWDQISLTPKKRAILVLWSSELNEDSIINMADDLAAEAAYEFSTIEDQCGFIGDGTSTYAGMRGVAWKFETENTSLAGLATCVAANDATDEIDLADFIGAMAKLPEYARVAPGTGWFCSSYVFAAAMQRLAYGQGGVTVRETTQGTGYSFLGYPVYISQVLNSTSGTDASKVKALFGNLRLAATMGVRRATEVAVSTEYAFATDQIALKATTRFDINVHDVGTNSVAGPIVALRTST